MYAEESRGGENALEQHGKCGMQANVPEMEQCRLYVSGVIFKATYLLKIQGGLSS